MIQCKLTEVGVDDKKGTNGMLACLCDLASKPDRWWVRQSLTECLSYLDMAARMEFLASNFSIKVVG